MEWFAAICGFLIGRIEVGCDCTLKPCFKIFYDITLATHRAGWTLSATCASTRPTSTSPTSTTTLASWSPVTRWAWSKKRSPTLFKPFSQGHYPVVEYLLNTGADPNAKVTSTESFPLYMDSPLQILFNCKFTRLVSIYKISLTCFSSGPLWGKRSTLLCGDWKCGNRWKHWTRNDINSANKV